MPQSQIKALSLADWITMVRVMAVPVVIATTLLQLQTITGWIILIAVGTDLIDGPIARRLKTQTQYGARFDSVADASIFLISAFSLVWFFKDFAIAHAWEISILMGLYFFQLAYSLIRWGKVTSYHTYAAKLSAIIEGLFIISCFFWQPLDWAFYITIAVGLIEQADEIALLFILPELRDNLKGTYWVLKEK